MPLMISLPCTTRESWSWATHSRRKLRLHLKKLAEKESNIASITAAWHVVLTCCYGHMAEMKSTGKKKKKHPKGSLKWILWMIEIRKMEPPMVLHPWFTTESKAQQSDLNAKISKLEERATWSWTLLDLVFQWKFREDLGKNRVKSASRYLQIFAA